MKARLIGRAEGGQREGGSDVHVGTAFVQRRPSSCGQWHIESVQEGFPRGKIAPWSRCAVVVDRITCAKSGGICYYISDVRPSLERRGRLTLGLSFGICRSLGAGAFSAPNRFFPDDEGIVVTRLRCRHPQSSFRPGRAARPTRLWS